MVWQTADDWVLGGSIKIISNLHSLFLFFLRALIYVIFVVVYIIPSLLIAAATFFFYPPGEDRGIL